MRDALPISFSRPLVPKVGDGSKTKTRRVLDLARLRVRLPYEVRSDPGALGPVIAKPGIYPARMNPQGAVSIVAPDGELLGVKPGEFDFLCPYAQGTTRLHKNRWHIEPREGSSLWVREDYRLGGFHQEAEGSDADEVARPLVLCEYLADGARREVRLTEAEAKKLSARRTDRDRALSGRYMYRSCARYLLSVASICIERIQDISEEDAKAEGVQPSMMEEHWTAYDPETDGYPSFGVPPDPTRFESIRHHPPEQIGTARDAFRRLWGDINGLSGPKSWEANPWVWAITFHVAEVRR